MLLLLGGDVLLPNTITATNDIVSRVRDQPTRASMEPAPGPSRSTTAVDTSSQLAAVDESAAERAAAVISAGNISLDAKLSVFTVTRNGRPASIVAVPAPPRESYSCPVSGGCYHLLAAKQAIGTYDAAPNHVLNLTQLRRNR